MLERCLDIPLECTILCGPVVLVIKFVVAGADVVQHQGNICLCELSVIKAIVNNMMSIDAVRAHGI